MSHGEGLLITAAIAVAVVVVLDFTRPKASRIFAKGPNGETDLLWDPKTAMKPSGQ